MVTDVQGDSAEGDTLHYSRMGEGLTVVPDLHHYSRLTTLCLHGNSLQRIEHLDSLPSLTELNLSSNNIAVMQGLSRLTNLRLLNLSSNRIEVVQGLKGLMKLERVLLAHNFIRSLSGFQEMHGGNYALQTVDLRGNCLSSLQELSVLAGCVNLRELMLSGGVVGNPLCKLPDYRLAVCSALPHITSLDSSACCHMHTASGVLQRLAAVRLSAFEPPPASHQPKGQGMPKIDVALSGFHRKPANDASNKSSRGRVPCGYTDRMGEAEVSNRLETANGSTHDSRLAAIEDRLIKLLDFSSKLPLVALHDTVESPDEPTIPAPKRSKRTNPRIIRRAETGTQTSCSAEDIEKLQSELEQLQEQLKTTTQDMQSKLQAAEAKTSEAQAAQSAAEERMHYIMNQTDQTVAEVTQQAKEQLALARRDAVKLKKQLQETQSTLSSAEQRNQHLEAQVTQLSNRCFVSEEESSAKLRRANESCERLMVQTHKLEAELAAAHGQFRSEADKSRQLEEQLHKARRECHLHKEQAATTNCRAAFEAHSLRELTQSLQEEIAGLQVQLRETQMRESNLQQQLSDMKQQLAQSEERASSLISEHKHDLHQLHNSYQKQLHQEQEAKARLQIQEQQARELLQSQLTAAEDEVRVALQEASLEVSSLHAALDQERGERCRMTQLIRAAAADNHKHKATMEKLMTTVTQQKQKIKVLSSERAELLAHVNAYNPDETERLRAQVANLREHMGQLHAVKEQLAAESSQRSSLERQLLEMKHLHEGMLEDTSSRLVAADKAIIDVKQRSQEHIAQLCGQLAQSHERVSQLQSEVQSLKESIRVKEVMLEDATATISQLKTQLEAAGKLAEDAQKVAETAEADRDRHEAEQSTQVEHLRAEIEAQESTIEALEQAAADAVQRADSATQQLSALQTELKEKDEMIKYVEQEVDRLKGLFEDKGQRLQKERDEARMALEELTQQHQKMMEELTSAQHNVSRLTSQLLVCQQSACAALSQSLHWQENANNSAERVIKVENEMRDLLLHVDQQRMEAAQKMQRLAGVLQEMNIPFLTP